MGYEYQLTGSIDSTGLYGKIKCLIASLPGYVIVFSDEASSGFKNKFSESGWTLDIELSFSLDGVFLTIHGGNTKKILNFINESLALSNTCISIEEL